MTMKRRRTPLNPFAKDVAFTLLKNILPSSWVIHDYGADYGMDCLIEIFDPIGNNRKFTDTLGEMLYIKLKVAPNFLYSKKKVYPKLMPNTQEHLTEQQAGFFEVEMASVKFEVEELLAVQAMRPAVPVLLILIDTSLNRAFFICLNDYVDKVLLATDPFFATKESRVIHVPLTNEILCTESHLMPLRAYGKRAKMYAAFTRFSYQRKEIEKIFKAITYFHEKVLCEQIVETVKAFALATLHQDIWHFYECWRPVMWSHKELDELLVEIDKGIDPSDVVLFLQSCQQIWQRLDNLANIYEDLVREWFMPTFLSRLIVCPDTELALMA